MIETLGTVVGALLLGLAAFCSILALTVALRAVRASRPEEGPGGFAWQSILFAVVVDLLVAAALGYGKALELLTEGWAAVVGIVTALFGGWLGYKVGKQKVEAKGSTTTPIGGGE